MASSLPFFASLIAYWPFWEPFLDKSLTQEYLASGQLLGKPDLQCIREALDSPVVCKPPGHLASLLAGLAAQSVHPPKLLHLSSSPGVLQHLGPSVQNGSEGVNIFLIAYSYHLYIYILLLYLLTNHFKYMLVDPFYS